MPLEKIFNFSLLIYLDIRFSIPTLFLSCGMSPSCSLSPYRWFFHVSWLLITSPNNFSLLLSITCFPSTTIDSSSLSLEALSFPVPMMRSLLFSPATQSLLSLNHWADLPDSSSMRSLRTVTFNFQKDVHNETRNFIPFNVPWWCIMYLFKS